MNVLQFQERNMLYKLKQVAFFGGVGGHLKMSSRETEISVVSFCCSVVLLLYHVDLSLTVSTSF